MSTCSARLYEGCPGKPTCERRCVPVYQVPRTAEPTVTGFRRTFLGLASFGGLVSVATYFMLTLERLS